MNHYQKDSTSFDFVPFNLINLHFMALMNEFILLNFVYFLIWIKTYLVYFRFYIHFMSLILNCRNLDLWCIKHLTIHLMIEQ